MQELKLQSDVTFANADGKRRFSMVAYSGQPVNYNGRNTIVDLSTLKHSQTIPVLLDHESKRRVGFSDKITSDKALNIDGTIIAGSDGEFVAQSADQGFPWQASVRVVGKPEEVKAGESKQVNGIEFAGPGVILRNGLLRETSFVTLGCDPDTSALVMEEQPTMTAKDISKAVADALKAELPKLKAELIASNTGREAVAFTAEQTPDPDATLKAEMVAAFGEEKGVEALKLYKRNMALGLFSNDGGNK